jgi:hypothetical protein
MCAFPVNIDPTSPAGTDSPSLGDDQFRALKQDILDLFGIPASTNIAASGLEFGAAGLTSIVLQDAAALSTTLGKIQRNAKQYSIGDGNVGIVLGGTLHCSLGAIGNIGAGEDQLHFFTFHANTFSAASRGIRITANGLFAANGNIKTLRWRFGPGTMQVVNNNVATAAPNGQPWRCVVEVWRTGANTQFVSIISHIGTNVGIVNSVNAAETDTATITTQFSGESAGAATDDIIQYNMLIEVVN